LAPATNLVIDGSAAVEETTYSSSKTVESDFDWINS